MARKKRLTGAALADFAAAYGLPPGLDYLGYVQLHLNVERTRARRVVDMADAARIAAGESELPREWIGLLAENRKEESLWVAEEMRRSLGR